MRECLKGWHDLTDPKEAWEAICNLSHENFLGGATTPQVVMDRIQSLLTGGHIFEEEAQEQTERIRGLAGIKKKGMKIIK